MNNLRVKTNNLDSANYQLRARNYQLEKLFNTSGKYSVNNLLNKIDRLTKENVMLSFENKQLKKGNHIDTIKKVLNKIQYFLILYIYYIF